MFTTNNMINLLIIIILTFLLFCGLMFSLSDLETLSKPYSQILKDDSTTAIVLMVVSIIGITIITIVANFFFEKDLKEQIYIDQVFDDYF